MRLIGCDLHARQQSIAMLDRDTGAVIEKTLKHEDEAVREFYASIPRGGMWQPDGTILFAPNPVGPQFRVPSSGGTAVAVTKLEPGQNDHRAPFLLPDGRHFLYYSRGTASARRLRRATRRIRIAAAR
jgi:hypothetical protein